MDASALKIKHRRVRELQPQGLRVRVHRAISWLGRAEREVADTDARFDVQVAQRLPFLSSTGADWELVVAVRNLFRDGEAIGSVYDELLVIRPPKRVVGGVLVKF